MGRWRVHLLVVGLIFGFLWAGSLPQSVAAQQNERVQLTIGYAQPEAGEVVLVWGVNGWQALPEGERPSQTTIHDGVMWTPMAQADGQFAVTLALPAGTTVEYGFLVTQRLDGTAVSIWEANGSRDFQVVVADEQILVHQSAISLFEDAVITVPAAGDWVTQQIFYELPEAGEVVLVWGLDGWKRLPEANLPTNTTLQDGVMHTSLMGNGRYFSTALTVPAGTTLDFGFLITRKRTGEAITAWEANGNKDFHAAADESTPVRIQSKLALAAFQTAQPPLAPGWGWVAALLLLFLLGSWGARWLAAKPVHDFRQTAVWILATTLVLLLFMLVIRANLLGVQWLSWRISWVLLPMLLAAGLGDVVYGTAVAAVFLLLAWMLRRRPRGLRLLKGLFGVVVTLSLLLAIANIQVLYLLGQPASVQLFYYADFLNSADSQSNLADNLPVTVVLSLLLASLAFWAISRCVAHGCQRWLRVAWWPALPGLLAIFVLPGTLFGEIGGWRKAQLVNPVVALVDSVVETGQRPVLSTLPLPDGFAAEFASVVAPGRLPFASDLPVRNVVFVVLESVGADYVSSYGGDARVTPVLTSLRSEAIQFDNIYAHAPASNKSLVSLLGGIYPWISYRSITQEQPSLPMPTLSSVLQENGYRTAFFSTGDWRFQQSDKFLAERPFDLVQDLNSLPCEGAQFSHEAELYAGGADDGCLVDALANWVAEDGGERPFFAMLWTVETHYPYFLVENEIDFGVSDPAFNRYLNGLHHSDAEIGRLIDLLAKSGQLEETLIVVTGDHGEAFGQHGQFGHALGIYEENVHVPLYLIHAGLFSGETADSIGGHVDIAPTILHVLDIDAPDSWQGSSLFAPDRNGRTFFYSPWADALFGLREAERKLIFNASSNQTAVYNLQDDPAELENLAAQDAAFVQVGQQRLAAWVQGHGRFTENLFAQGSNP
ncbi:MAG: sulfatase [Anaerolineales bacterium]|nr:sulfatase [Anaerolineales bacterium]